MRKHFNHRTGKFSRLSPYGGRYVEKKSKKSNTARKVYITVVLAIGFALLVSALSGCAGAKTARVAVPAINLPVAINTPVTIVRSPSVIPWPSEFAQVFDKLKDVRQRVDEMDKWRAQAALGVSDAIDWLRTQIPPGMTVDETRRAFVPIPPAPPASSPAPGGPVPVTPAAPPPAAPGEVHFDSQPAPNSTETK